MRSTVAAVAIGVLLSGVWAKAAPVVPLKVTEPVGVARVKAPVSGGVPVGPLGVKDVKALVLADAGKQYVPAQITPMVTHEDGNLLWVLVDFLTDLKANETRNFVLVNPADVGWDVLYPVNPEKTPPVAADVTDKAVTLSNGLVKIELSKIRFDLFEDVWVDRDGDGRFAAEEKVLAHGNTGGTASGLKSASKAAPPAPVREPLPGVLADGRPAALVVVRGKDGAAFSTRDGKVHSVTLEDPGPIRTTVRIDGDYGDGKGQRYLKYTVRVTMWAGRPDLKVLYALRNTNPEIETQEQIQRASVTLKLAEPVGMKHYLVGASGVNMSQINKAGEEAIKGSQWHDRVRLSQVGPPEQVCGKTHRQFYWVVRFPEGVNFDDAGYRVEQFQHAGRKPFVDVGFKCSGWIDLAGDKGGCQVWLRNFTHDTPKRMEAAADGTISLDVIPQHDGPNQPYYRDGGYWLGDRSHRTYELNFHFHGKPLVSEADWAQWRNQFYTYVPPTPATAETAEGIVQQARHPLQLVATPQWYTQTGAMWGPMPSLEEEQSAAQAMGRSRVGPVRPLPTGETVGTDFIHYENFHYRSEWDEPRDAIVEFLRTGEQHYYRRAHTFARNYRDLGVPRTDGLPMSGRARGVMGAGPVPRWGKFCGCHNYGAGLIDMWLITGDRSYRDAGVEYGYDHASDPRPYGGFGDRHWGRRVACILRAYDVTRDPNLKAWLVKHGRPRIPDDALRADGRALVCGKHQSSWMTGLCGHAVWHNLRLNGDAFTGIERDDYEDQIVGIARNVAKYWYFEKFNGGPYWLTFDEPKPGEVSAPGGGMAYTSSCIDMMTRGYLLTGDRTLLERARLFWDLVNGEDRGVLSARLQDFHGMGSNCFWARQLIYEYAHPRKDQHPPTPVVDLTAEALGGGRVNLTWTAPTDQGGGTVAAYQVKHAPKPFCTFDAYRFPEDHNKKWTWWAGYNVADEPKPGKPGARETMVVSGVPAGTRYFCLRARDAEPNESAMSNCVSVEVR